MSKKELTSKVFQSLGEASMCWTETPKGVFESEKAERIGNELMKVTEAYAQANQRMNAIQFAAEYLYKLKNPDSKFSEPPSMIYEQVERAYDKWILSIVSKPKGTVCDQCGGRNTWMIDNYINCGDCQTCKKQTEPKTYREYCPKCKSDDIYGNMDGKRYGCFTCGKKWVN